MYFLSQSVHRFLIDNEFISYTQDKSNGIILFSFLSTVILAPILEELVFRVHALGVPKEAASTKVFFVCCGFICFGSKDLNNAFTGI